MGLGRLTVPPRLPYADVLRTELANFQVRVTAAAHEVYAARAGQHDDLVISVALPVWLAGMPFVQMREPGPGAESVILPQERDAAAAEAEVIRRTEEEALRLEQGEENEWLRAARYDLDNPIWWS